MRGRPPQISQDALLEAATEVLLRDGTAATTAEIARRAGVSEGLLFYHFKSKEQLIAAVMRRKLALPQRLMELVQTSTSQPVEESLYELCSLVLENFRVGFPFMEIARKSPESEAIMRSLIRSGASPQRLMEIVAAFFEAEAAHGRLRAVAPSLVGRVIIGTALDRVLREHSPGELAPLDTDQSFLRGLVELLLHGAAPPLKPPGRSKRT